MLHPHLQIWLSDGIARIPFFVHLIIYAKAFNQYSIVYYLDEADNTIKNITITKGLGVLEKKLVKCNFLRTGKSNLVNLAYVKKFHTKGKGLISIPILQKEIELSANAKRNLLKRTNL